MKKTIRTIGLFGRYRDKTLGNPLNRLATYLHGRGLRVLVGEQGAGLVNAECASAKPDSEIGREIDLAIVVGGDGTMLNAIRTLAPLNVPVIGVNRGRLGFLADIAAHKMLDDIGRILDGDHQHETRLLLAAEILRKGKVVHAAVAVNDVIVTKGELARMIEFDVYLNGEFVSGARGDGVIVSSPTGSTAYAMSAGGPILHPALPALALVPICPHTLSFRPLVVSADSVIQVVMSGQPDQRAHVSFDGQSSFPLADDDHVFVRRAPYTVELVHPGESSYFDVLRHKLHWGKKF